MNTFSLGERKRTKRHIAKQKEASCCSAKQWQDLLSRRGLPGARVKVYEDGWREGMGSRVHGCILVFNFHVWPT